MYFYHKRCCNQRLRKYRIESFKIHIFTTIIWNALHDYVSFINYSQIGIIVLRTLLCSLWYLYSEFSSIQVHIKAKKYVTANDFEGAQGPPCTCLNPAMNGNRTDARLDECVTQSYFYESMVYFNVPGKSSPIAITHTFHCPLSHPYLASPALTLLNKDIVNWQR